MTYVQRGGLRVDPILADFVEFELLARLPLTPDVFWINAEALFEKFTPRNAALLARRLSLQEQIDGWHRKHPGKPEQADYLSFLGLCRAPVMQVWEHHPVPIFIHKSPPSIVLQKLPRTIKSCSKD